MRIESSVTAVSWLPSEAVRGIRKLAFSIGAARYDDPPPDRLEDAPALAQSGAVRLVAPVAWTTLGLTIRVDGAADGSLAGASSFPRHWVYDADGRLASKSAEIDFGRWLQQPSDLETPWGQEGEGVSLAAAESEL